MPEPAQSRPNGAKSRVLILSTSAGEGHVRAGEALRKAFAARSDCVVTHIDTLDYTSKLFQKIYDDAYIALVRRAPSLMGLLYHRFDRPWQHPRRRLALDRLNTGPMIRLLKRLQPDLCVATHFLPEEIIAWLRRKHKLGARLAVVITDFDVHSMWLCHNVDRYYVPLDETGEYLSRIGIPAPSIRVTGIPIDPAFSEPKDRRAIQLSHGLDPDRPTLLVSAGGHSLGPVEQLVTDLLAFERPWQIVAIIGRAEAIRRKLEKISSRAGKFPGGCVRLHVVGYTQEMDQWMAASDLLAGKAGGLTVSEALASGLPMAIVGSLAGPQEERNADILLERGAAIRCNNLPTAGWKIAQVMDDPARLARMRAAARAMARPRAAVEIAADCIQLLQAAGGVEKS